MNGIDWQGFSPQGVPSETHLDWPLAAAGELHGASHVWIWRQAGREREILLQRRSSTSMTWPGFYDISAAGHIDYGENPLQAALRESKEELGIEVDVERLRLLFVNRQHFVSDDTYKAIENEFRWVYSLEATSDFEMAFEDGEVSATTWVSMDTFMALIADEVEEMTLVPQGKVYFDCLLEGLERFANL